MLFWENFIESVRKIIVQVSLLPTQQITGNLKHNVQLIFVDNNNSASPTVIYSLCINNVKTH